MQKRTSWTSASQRSADNANSAEASGHSDVPSLQEAHATDTKDGEYR